MAGWTASACSKFLADDLPPVQADPDAMKRAIANLVDNAAEAMQDSLVKEIQISTALPMERDVGRDRCRRHRTWGHLRAEGEALPALLLHQEARHRPGARDCQPHRGRPSRIDSRGGEFVPWAPDLS